MNRRAGLEGKTVEQQGRSPTFWIGPSFAFPNAPSWSVSHFLLQWSGKAASRIHLLIGPTSTPECRLPAGID